MTIHEKSYGAIVYRQDNKKIFYLLLLYERDGREYWDFPKGHAEAGENHVTAMKREVKEETNINHIDVTEGFEEKEHFFFRRGGELVSKDVTFYLCKTEQEQVKESFEHKDVKWYEYEDAMKIMKFKNSREILKKGHDFLMHGRVVFQKKLI